FAYIVGGGHSLRHGGGHTGVEVIEILLGLGLIALGVRRWRVRREPRQPSSGLAKSFTGRLTELRPFEAAAVGVLEQPWTITAPAAAIVIHHHGAFVVSAAAFVLFSLASTATVGLMFLYYARKPGEAEARLADIRARLVAAGPAILAAVSCAVGVILVL